MVQRLLRIELFGRPAFTAVDGSTKSPGRTRHPPPLLIDKKY